jgi:hypothetical protein
MENTFESWGTPWEQKKNPYSPSPIPPPRPPKINIKKIN